VTDQTDDINHVAPPQIAASAARAIAKANAKAGFPTPPAVQAAIDAGRKGRAPAVPTGDSKEIDQ
jgi:hypothetical protein